MPLVTSKEMLSKAQEGGYAVGALMQRIWKW